MIIVKMSIPKDKIAVLKNLLIFGKKYLPQSVRLLEGGGVETLFGRIPFEHRSFLRGASLTQDDIPYNEIYCNFELWTLSLELWALNFEPIIFSWQWGSVFEEGKRQAWSVPRFFLCVFCSFLSLRLFIIAPFSCVFHRGFAVDTTVQWSVGGRMPSGPGPFKTVNNVRWTCH